MKEPWGGVVCVLISLACGTSVGIYMGLIAGPGAGVSAAILVGVLILPVAMFTLAGIAYGVFVIALLLAIPYCLMMAVTDREPGEGFWHAVARRITGSRT